MNSFRFRDYLNILSLRGQKKKKHPRHNSLNFTCDRFANNPNEILDGICNKQAIPWCYLSLVNRYPVILLGNTQNGEVILGTYCLLHLPDSKFCLETIVKLEING